MALYRLLDLLQMMVPKMWLQENLHHTILQHSFRTSPAMEEAVEAQADVRHVAT